MKTLLIVALIIVGTFCVQKPFTSQSFESCLDAELQKNGCNPVTKAGARCYNFFKTFDYTKYHTCASYGALYGQKSQSNLSLKGAKMYEECLFDITASLAPSKYLDMFTNVAQCVESNISTHFGAQAQEFQSLKAKQAEEDEYFYEKGDGEKGDGEHDGEDGEDSGKTSYSLVQYFGLNVLIVVVLFFVL